MAVQRVYTIKVRINPESFRRETFPNRYTDSIPCSKMENNFPSERWRPFPSSYGSYLGKNH
jgi:hypothetical protein